MASYVARTGGVADFRDRDCLLRQTLGGSLAARYDRRRFLPIDQPTRDLAMKTARLFGRLAIVWSAAVVTAACAFGADPVNGPKTPLDEYVAKADPAYKWEVVNTIRGDGVTTFIVDLKSQ